MFLCVNKAFQVNRVQRLGTSTLARLRRIRHVNRLDRIGKNDLHAQYP